MTELKKVRLAIKYAIRRNQELFKQGRDWKSFDVLIKLLLGVIEDLGFSKEETIALYEEIKREVEKELKEGIAYVKKNKYNPTGWRL